MIEKIRDYYNKGLYEKRHMKVYCQKGVITPEQYEEITGEAYQVNQ